MFALSLGLPSSVLASFSSSFYHYKGNIVPSPFIEKQIFPLFPVVLLKVLVLNLIGCIWIVYPFKPITVSQGTPCSLISSPWFFACSWNWGCDQLNPITCNESGGDVIYKSSGESAYVLLSEEVEDACWGGCTIGLPFGSFKYVSGPG